MHIHDCSLLFARMLMRMLTTAVATTAQLDVQYITTFQSFTLNVYAKWTLFFTYFVNLCLTHLHSLIVFSFLVLTSKITII